MRRGDHPFVDADLRCSCGKLRAVDVGPGLFGQAEIVEFCLSCGPVVQAGAWESDLLAAVATVAAGRNVHKGATA